MVLPSLLLVFSAAFGLVVGSFLGCCIYRVPRGISLLSPRRSFCPACQKPISWKHNVPVLSWLMLRGRCPNCKESISARYPIVEALTASLFFLAAWQFGFPVTLSFWVLFSLLIIATFIDLEFLIIPDLVSKSGIVAGLLCSVLTPELQHTTSRPLAAILSLAGALSGGGILFVVGEAGKLLFGRYQINLKAPTHFRFEHIPPDDAHIVIDEESFRWSDHFFRKTDRIKIRAAEVTINEQFFARTDLDFYHDRLVTTQGAIPLQEVRTVTGQTRHAEFPREAMGLGDVKLLAAIGAFTGWQGVVFSVPMASFIGAGFGLVRALIRRDWSSKIPFGPYLAFGALLWIFCGNGLVDWYCHLLYGQGT
jgi:leader peptidase (prepilin peptidase)/N-methyltransferase